MMSTETRSSNIWTKDYLFIYLGERERDRETRRSRETETDGVRGAFELLCFVPYYRVYAKFVPDLL